MAKANLMDYEKALELFEVVIGLEVHIELNTKTKMFCGCKNDFGDEPNTNVCPICIGLPGSLPVVNRKAVESSISIGLALACQIAPTGGFSRKNYFYPDLAKNYQTSQFRDPIAFDGQLDVEVPSGKKFTVLIERAHMEEDAGKLTHIGGSTGRIQGAEYSLVDYNRAGVPLVEIVTRPVLGAGAEAPESPPEGAAIDTAAAAGSIPYSSFKIAASSLTSLTVRLTSCSAKAFKSAIVFRFKIK